MVWSYDSYLKWFTRADNKPSIYRRLKFGTVVIISQILLLTLAVAWLIHAALIAANGSVYFVERNPFILWSEIIATLLITFFAIYVLVLQLQRLGERRHGDNRQTKSQN